MDERVSGGLTSHLFKGTPTNMQLGSQAIPGAELNRADPLHLFGRCVVEAVKRI